MNKRRARLTALPLFKNIPWVATLVDIMIFLVPLNKEFCYDKRGYNASLNG